MAVDIGRGANCICLPNLEFMILKGAKNWPRGGNIFPCRFIVMILSHTAQRSWSLRYNMIFYLAEGLYRFCSLSKYKHSNVCPSWFYFLRSLPSLYFLTVWSTFLKYLVSKQNRKQLPFVPEMRAIFYYLCKLRVCICTQLLEQTY